MERGCDNIREDNVVEVGYVTNISYFYAFGFEALKLKYTLLMLSNLDAKWQPIFYGYPPNGNPLNIDIRFYWGLPAMALSRALRNLRRTLLIHVHIGSTMRDLYPVSVISSSYRVPTIIKFHGTDVREMEKLKKTFYSLLRLCNKYVYFAGSTPDLLSYGIQMFWLPNPVDPFALSFRCRRASDAKVAIFIPTRFDRNKYVHFFLYRFYQAINSRYINPKNYVLKVVRGGGRNLLALVDVLVHKLKQNGVDVIVLPLLNRERYLYELCHSSIVIGQFKLGIYSQVELEALAMSKHVRSMINRPLYFRFIGEAPPVYNYNPLHDTKGKDLSAILNNFNPDLENTAGRHYVLKYHQVEKIALTILKVLGLK
ncbi:MAG: hypothetical protein QXM43_00140 [Desulfurococcaceae archaeon]